MKKILYFLFVLFAFAPFIANGQGGCEALIKDARTLAKNLKFDEAVKKVEAAKGCAAQADIDRLYSEIFAGLRKQTIEANKAKDDAVKAKDNAVKARDEADKARERAEKAEKDVKDLLVQVDNEKQIAVTEKQNALAAKEAAEAAGKRATDVLNKIYFYNDQFGLAAQLDNMELAFGFIDKNLHTKIGFKYETASSFRNGYAVCKRFLESQNFINEKDEPIEYYAEVLVDTSGNEFLLRKTTTDVPTFETPDKIQALDMSDNYLVKFPTNKIPFKDLLIVRLSNNLLENIPKQLLSLYDLEVLQVDYNRIKELPSEIGQLSELKELDLTNNELPTLPSEIGQLYNLKKLCLRKNYLITLPADIQYLSNLEELYAGENQLKSIPVEIGDLSNLNQLHLCCNKLDSLPTEIGQLKRLASLNLYNNKLKYLPPAIGGLKNLKMLHLQDNLLVKLPDEIRQLINLRYINLSNNSFDAFPPQLTKLNRLEELGFSNNSLREFPDLWALINLKELGLNGNKLTEIPSKITFLKNLQRFAISENQITALPPEITALKNLQELDISNNKITNLPKEIRLFKSLKKLNLNGNPLTDTYVDQLRKDMPWCEIEFSPTETLKKNQALRKEMEVIILQGEELLKIAPNDTTLQKELSIAYNSLGWRQILTGQFSEAEVSINRARILDSTHVYLPLNRASSLLFQGKTVTAFQEYERWKDRPFGQNNWPFYRDAFLRGLDELENAGIIPDDRKADVAAVRALLGVKKE
jgi:Leucine-rich repeat (LRR) protein